MTTLIEYRVRPVTRYVVTRYEADGAAAGSGPMGEYANEETAYAVAYALCKADHERLGWPPGDERIQYPTQPFLRRDSLVIGERS
jgi:hypothetical protein